jgi:serine/threonine-protein kinase
MPIDADSGRVDHRFLELLDTFLTLPASERAAWVDALRDESPDVQQKLRNLLTREARLAAGAFLESLPALAGAIAPRPDIAAAPGERIGPYRLERSLGAGGMSSVWLAERTDGLLKRKVALKLPHMGGVLSGLAERMARERDIVAALEHPNIARLYDAGVAEDGRPYLALEYVEGEPIDRYCERCGLDVARRVRLVVQVARAVAYAHAHLIVHRDLKPSNILVDADEQVHLLDFGIAKLLDPSGTADPRLTEFAGRALTPDYASPEQVRGEPVSTATDVYSLGVVLYELLAGRSPHTVKSAFDALALAQAIVTVEATRPSELSSGAAARRALRGDLDTIVLKALKKDPRERYGSMAEFADDLERFLRGAPVRARPDSSWYRARKFVKRNTLGVVAAASVVIALAVGLGLATWQAHVARVNAARAPVGSSSWMSLNCGSLYSAPNLNSWAP